MRVRLGRPKGGLRRDETSENKPLKIKCGLFSLVSSLRETARFAGRPIERAFVLFVFFVAHSD